MARLDTIQLTSSSTSDGPPTQLAPAAAAALRRKLQRRTVPFLFLVMFLALIDRANLSFAALTMKAELGMTDLQYGFGSSIFYSSYVVMQVPAVWVARRLGAPRTLGIIMFAWGGCAFAFALLPIVPRPISAFYLLRVALGAAEGGLIPVVYYALAQWFAAADLTVAFGQVLSASCISNALGGLLAAAILRMDGQLGLAGWQWIFIVEAAPSILAALATTALLSKGPEHVAWLTPSERSHLAARLDRGDAASGGGSGSGGGCGAGGRGGGGGGGSTLRTLSDPRVWYLAATVFLPLNTLWALVYWQPLLIAQITPGASVAGVAALSALPYGVATVSMLLNSAHSAGRPMCGRACAGHARGGCGECGSCCCGGGGGCRSRSPERRWHAVVPLALGGAATALAPLALKLSAGGVYLAFLLLCIANGGIWSAVPPLWSWPSEWLDTEGASLAVAAINSAGSLGGFSGPALVGAMSAALGDDERSTHSGALGVLGAASLLAALMAAAFRPEAAWRCDPPPR